MAAVGLAALCLTFTVRYGDRSSSPLAVLAAAPQIKSAGGATATTAAPRTLAPVVKVAPATVTFGVSYGTTLWDGLNRRWRLFLPPQARSARLPLLVMLHPAGGEADTFVSETSMEATAATYGFATLAPEGVDNTWNAGTCCGAARDKGVDDVGFVNAMLTRVLTDQPVDAGQVYVAGASNGGMFAYTLACRLSDRIQAVFSAGGAQTLGDCHPSTPVTVVEFHSLSDGLVPFYGGVDPKYRADLTDFASMQSIFRSWASIDQCPTRTVADAGPGEQVEVWYGCARGTLLEVWLRVTGGGHEWPTSPAAPVDATRTIAKAITSHQLVRNASPSVDPIPA